MSTAHTSGPWQTMNDYVPGCMTIIADVDGEIIDGTTHYSYSFVASCVDEDGEFSADAVANARLIAAAPELLEACQMCLPANVCTTNRNISDDVVIPLDVSMGDLRRLVAAIKKATGQ